VGCVQKILALLFLRTVLLPMCLGAVVLRGLLPLAPALDAPRVWTFCARHPLPCLALVWMAGIGYILVLTLNIVLLRQAIHPDVIESLVRWRVPHAGNQLLPLIIEPAALQLRRALLSWMGYLATVVLFVFLPVSFLPAVR
jgi:E3 ubiquitin-protein ligase MARCH6